MTAGRLRFTASAMHLFFTRLVRRLRRRRRSLGWPPPIAIAGCWLTIVFELGFAGVLWLPEPAGLALLATGLAFHVTTAVMMGLNVFVWAFAAAYPAVMFFAKHGFLT